jgi:hypothetical protein
MLNLHQPHGSFDIADLMLNLHWNRAPHAATEMNFSLHLPHPITCSNPAIDYRLSVIGYMSLIMATD